MTNIIAIEGNATTASRLLDCLYDPSENTTISNHLAVKVLYDRLPIRLALWSGTGDDALERCFSSFLAMPSHDDIDYLLIEVLGVSNDDVTTYAKPYGFTVLRCGMAPFTIPSWLKGVSKEEVERLVNVERVERLSSYIRYRFYDVEWKEGTDANTGRLALFANLDGNEVTCVLRSSSAYMEGGFLNMSANVSFAVKGGGCDERLLERLRVSVERRLKGRLKAMGERVKVRVEVV